MVSRAFSTDFPSCGAPYSCPFRLSFHSQKLSPPWVCSPNSTFRNPAPLHNKQLTTQAGMHRAVVQTMQAVLTLSCLPQTIHWILLKFPQKFFSVPAVFSTVRKFFWVWGLPLTFSFPPGLLVPVLIPLFLFSSYILPSCDRIFLVLLGVWSLLLMISRCSMRNVPFVDVFSMYLWGVMNSTSSYSTILTPPSKTSFILLSLLPESSPLMELERAEMWISPNFELLLSF